MTRQISIETQKSTTRHAAAMAETKPTVASRRRPSRNGQSKPATQLSDAVAADAAIRHVKPNQTAQHRLPSNGGHGDSETHSAPAAIDHVGQMSTATQCKRADVIVNIQALWRRRQAWHRAEKSLTLAAGAPCRGLSGGDKKLGAELLERVEKNEAQLCEPDISAAMIVGPLLSARSILNEQRDTVEKQLTHLAKSLPIWKDWAEPIPRFGLLGLAGLIGECGDIGGYKSVAAIWKRMGVAVVNGERQRKVKDAIAALEHGYSPARRSVLWNIGNSLIGATVGGGPRPFVGEDISGREEWSEWQKLFVTRLRQEAERDPAHARDPVQDKKTGAMRESFSKHAAARAKRYVEKRFLARLYIAWRGGEWLGDGHNASETQKRTAITAAADHSWIDAHE